MSNLSDVVKNGVVKKTVYDKLVEKVNKINSCGFVLKTKYDADKLELEKKNSIQDTSELVKNTNYNTKITGIEYKIPSLSGLATNAALTAVESKIPYTCSLVKKKQQIITQKLLKLKRNLMIIIMTNILQSLIS